MRSLAVAQLKEKNENPYPHKFHVSTSLEEFINAYSDLKDGEVLENKTLSVAGMGALKFTM